MKLNIIRCISITLYFCVLYYTFYNLSQVNVPENRVEVRSSDLELEVVPQEKKQELPIRLEIPEINVSAAIEYVGVTKGNEMAVPSDSTNIGWFDLGTIPGELGSAVVAGHLDDRRGKVGVFNNLYKLKKGDELSVIDQTGAATSFVVREVRSYIPGFADEVFYSSDNKAHLNLITCEGSWNDIRKSYNKRLVVFTDIKSNDDL